MRNSAAVILATALLVGSAFAADLDPSEKKWLTQCMENLSGKSALCRASAEKAITGLGTDALPAIVGASSKLKTDADWQGLGRAIAAMGGEMRKAVNDLRMSWPKGTETRFAAILDFLEKAESDAKKNAAANGALPTSPADIQAAVRVILDGFLETKTYKSDNAEVRRIVAMGHDAVGALLQFLRDDARDYDDWARRLAAQDALKRLATPADVPAMAGLLRQGRSSVATALAGLGTAEAMDALVDAVDRDFVDRDLLAPFDRMGRSAPKIDPKLGAAFVRWLGRPACASNQYELGSVADILAAAETPDSAAALLKRLPAIDQLQPKQRTAQAIAELGEKAGIPVLIDVLTMKEPFDGDRRFDYPRHCAGLALNRIAGNEIYTGKQVMGGGGGLPGLGSQHPEPQYDGDFPATAAAFREWWAKAKDKLVFDAATRAWSTK